MESGNKVEKKKIKCDEPYGKAKIVSKNDDYINNSFMYIIINISLNLAIIFEI